MSNFQNSLINIDRELIFTTLFNYLKDNLENDVFTFTRRLKTYSDVPTSDMPYLCLTQGNQVPTTDKTRMKAAWNFDADIYIYVNIGNDNELSPYTILNPILDKIHKLFVIKDQFNYNMNGLINYVKINNVETDNGVLGQYAVGIIGLTINVIV